MRESARIVAGPVEDVLGDEAAVDHAAGATSLQVTDTADHAQEGGQVRLRLSEVGGTDLVVDYSGLDDDSATLFLAAPVAVAVPAGTRVDVWNPTTGKPSVEYVADIVFDGQEEGDSVPATVTQALLDRVPSLVQGGVGLSVVVEREEPEDDPDDEGDGDDELRVTEVLGLPLSLDLSYADPDTAPPGLGDSGPTEPPASSPALLVTGLPNALVLRATDALEAGARVQYHLSTVDGFTPDASTAVGPETSAGVLVLDALTDGTPLALKTTYYARAVAVNDLGAAGAGVQAMGSLDVEAVRTVVTAELVSGFILTGRIQIGQAYIDADDGFHIPNPDGTESVIPFNGDPIDFVATVTALTLTTEGLATFLGLVRVAKSLQINDGVTAPGAAPDVVPHWPSIEVSSAPGYGLVEQSGNSTRWVRAQGQRGDGTFLLASSPKAGGEDEAHVVVAPIGTPAGLAVVGSRYYVLGRQPSGEYRVWVLESNFTPVTSWAFASSLDSRPAIGTNGSNLVIAWSTSTDQLVVREYTTAGSQVGSQTVLLAAGQYAQDTAGIYVGTGNYGSNRIVVQPADADAMVWSGTLASPTRQTAQDFPRALGASSRGLAYADGRFYALTATGQVAQHGSSSAGRTGLSFAHTWAGSNGSAFIETQTGPTKTFTIPAQAAALVTTGTPPEASESGDLKANRVAVYSSSTGSTTLRRQTALPVGARTYVVDTIGTNTTTNPTAQTTNGFANISAPGDIVPERGATNAAKMWRLVGTGAGWVSDLSWNADGVWTIGSRFFSSLLGMFRARSAGFRSNTTLQSIPNNTWTQVALTGTESHTSTRITRSGSDITVLDEGLYDVTMLVRWTGVANATVANGSGYRLQLERFTTQAVAAGETLIADAVGAHTQLVTSKGASDIFLAAGDKLRLICWQNSGSALTLANGQPAQLNLRPVG